MHWIQLKVQLAKNLSDQCESLLLEQGALVVTLEDAGDQPLFEPPPGETPLWDSLILTGLFNADTDGPALMAQIEQTFGADISQQKLEIVEDKDWVGEWKAQFKPIQFATNLWVCPSWCEPTDPEAVNLILDPGLAFGTGTHATTRLCLQWLADADLAGRFIIDYGCGSGILGIAALLLGGGQVLGIDNDRQALQATEGNRAINGIEPERLHTALPSPKHNQPADILVANILAQPLIDLQPTITALLKTNGHLALSGILEEQYPAVVDAYQDIIQFDPPQFDEGWVRLTGTKLADNS